MLCGPRMWWGETGEEDGKRPTVGGKTLNCVNWDPFHSFGLGFGSPDTPVLFRFYSIRFGSRKIIHRSWFPHHPTSCWIKFRQISPTGYFTRSIPEQFHAKIDFIVWVSFQPILMLRGACWISKIIASKCEFRMGGQTKFYMNHFTWSSDEWNAS